MPKEEKPNHDQSLPGMEDREIKELQEAALEYAKIRDRRQKLTGEEVELKEKLHGLMKTHKKKRYHYRGVDIQIVAKDETVKVRIESESDVE